MKARILLIEDEPGLLIAIPDLLVGAAYEVACSADGESGLAAAMTGKFDTIILDVMLPRKTGFEVCRELRQRGNNTPVLMLTARGQVVDRVHGLRLGADDYLIKPFDPAELLARIDALLRRAGKAAGIPVHTYEFGSVEIDFRSSEVRRSGLRINLAGKEIQLLRYLIQNRERVVPREEIMEQVWEYSNDAASRTIDTHVAWLRQKLGDNPQSPRYIQTIRGKGYRFTG